MQQIIIFDDSDLPEEDRIFIRCATGRIKDRMKRTVEDIIEIGRDLIAVKARLPHGRFQPYLKTEFELSYPLAAKFMQCAERFGGKSINFIDFSPSVLYALAAPIVPDEVVDAAIEIASAGQSITNHDVERLRQEVESLQRDKESTIKLLIEEKAALQREKEETAKRLIGERDREIKRRKQAEAISKASDREQEQARVIAEEREARMKAESLAASLQAQIEGGLGVTELLEPKVVIQEDTESRREVERLRKQLEEKTRLHEQAADHAGRFQEEMHKATSRAAYLENKLKEVEDTSVVLAVFARQVNDWKSQVGFVATVLKEKGQTLDEATVQTCSEIADRLHQLVEYAQDHDSLEAA